MLLKRERQQALQQGMQQGASEILTAQIIRKFGKLPEWARARMAHADEASLNHWAVHMLDAQRVEDVFV